jgi:hypothetical protein
MLAATSSDFSFLLSRHQLASQLPKEAQIVVLVNGKVDVT